MRTIIETYRGVEIWECNGLFIPDTNGGVQSDNIDDVREYIDNIWISVFV